MKQNRKSFIREYPPLVLHLDDLLQLEAVMQEDGGTCEIETREYAFDSVEELTDHHREQTLTWLKLKRRDPHISLDLTPRWAALYVGSDATTAMGLYHKIDGTLRRCRRRFWWSYGYPFVWPTSVVIGVVASRLFDSGRTRLWGIALFSLLAISLARVVFCQLWRYSIVVMARRGSIGQFLARNRDQLLVAVVAAFVGAVLGVAGTLLVSAVLQK